MKAFNEDGGWKLDTLRGLKASEEPSGGKNDKDKFLETTAAKKPIPKINSTIIFKYLTADEREIENAEINFKASDDHKFTMRRLYQTSRHRNSTEQNQWKQIIFAWSHAHLFENKFYAMLLKVCATVRYTLYPKWGRGVWQWNAQRAPQLNFQSFIRIVVHSSVPQNRRCYEPETEQVSKRNLV